jgi:hypothetical protein
MKIFLAVVLGLVALAVVWNVFSMLLGLAGAVVSVLVVLAVIIFVIGLVRRLVGV